MPTESKEPVLAVLPPTKRARLRVRPSRRPRRGSARLPLAHTTRARARDDGGMATRPLSVRRRVRAGRRTAHIRHPRARAAARTPPPGRRARGPSRTRPASSQSLFIGRHRLLAATAPAEVGRDCLPSPDTRLAQAHRIGEQLVDALGESLDVARWDEHEAVAGGRDLLRSRLAATADRRYAAGHSLYVGDPESLLGRRHRKQRATARHGDRLLVRQLTVKLDTLAYP